jgi:hypothetical protein
MNKLKMFVTSLCMAIVLSVSVGVFADDGTTTAMTTALTSVKTDSLAALAVVAPIAIAIMGAFLVWRYGIKFFKSLAK